MCSLRLSKSAWDSSKISTLCYRLSVLLFSRKPPSLACFSNPNTIWKCLMILNSYNYWTSNRTLLIFDFQFLIEKGGTTHHPPTFQSPIQDPITFCHLHRHIPHRSHCLRLIHQKRRHQRPQLALRRRVTLFLHWPFAGKAPRLVCE